MTGTTEQTHETTQGETTGGAGLAVDTFANIVAVCTPDEGGRHTVQTAMRVAGASGGRLTLLSVVEPPGDLDQIAEATGLSPEQIRERLAGEHREQLEKLAADCGLDPATSIAVRIGKPFIEIIRHVIENGGDLIIKTAEELSGLSRFLFASTDQHLLRKCPCPVWLLRGGAPQPIGCVLAAVDVDFAMASEPQTMASLNRHIIATAARIAALDGARVHVLYAWDAPGEGLVRLWSGADDREQAARSYVEELQSIYWRALDEVVGEARQQTKAQFADRVSFVATAERGPARYVIPEQVRTLGADVLVMGTVARSNVPGFIIGNTAEDVLNTVECPVVTVKPLDYHSPMEELI